MDAEEQARDEPSGLGSERVPQDAHGSGDVEGPKREGVLGVIGIALGLLLLLGMVSTMVGIRAGSVTGPEAEARMAELFVDGTPPPGFVLDSVKKLPTGEHVLRLVPEPTDSADPELAETAPRTWPEELLLIEYPRAASVKGLFAIPAPGSNGEKLLEWEADPTKTFYATKSRGELTWRSWLADYAVVRAFAEDKTWRDSARVNLSQPGRYLALFCQWPSEVESSDEQLKDLLASVALQEPDAVTD